MIKQSRSNSVDIVHASLKIKKLIQNSFLIEFFFFFLENTVIKNIWISFNFAYFVKHVFQNYRAYSFCGTIEYMAPEVVEGGSSGHDFVSTFLFYLYSTVDWGILSVLILSL